MVRQFSIPYNGINPEVFLQLMKPYSRHIHSVFLGINTLENNHQVYGRVGSIKDVNGNTLSVEQYDENVYQFLLKTKSKVKRLLTLNSGFYPKKTHEIYNWCDNVLIPFIKIVELDGVICTDYNMAKYLHDQLPTLEIHTSCNCFQWSIRQMELWRDNCGVKIFNPPREILRTPKKLKEMHDAGFKIKAIVNESCLYGCPQTMNHCMALGAKLPISVNCNRDDLANFFRSNWVLPRWLDELDKYVDIYKISGRTAEDYRYIFATLDAFIRGEDVDDIRKIFIGGTANPIKKNLTWVVPSTVIPDKLLTCECKECNKTCFICENLAKEFFKNEKIITNTHN